jgi:formate dehydrogenase
MFNKELIAKMKPGSWLVNTARGAICERDAVKEALESGHLRGYAGDVWGESSFMALKTMGIGI